MNELSEGGAFETWHHPITSITKAANDGTNNIPVVQGLILTHEDEEGNFWIIIRDEMERPIVAVKMSRMRFAWFYQNLNGMIMADFIKTRLFKDILDELTENQVEGEDDA